VYFAAFICTAVSSALLIAPSAYHRIRWRQRDKERLLRTSNTLAIAGTAFLGLAVTGAVFLVTDLLFGLLVTSLVSGVAAGAVAWLWFGLPLARRLDDEGALEPRGTRRPGGGRSTARERKEHHDHGVGTGSRRRTAR
jgi:hypothetical protein